MIPVTRKILQPLQAAGIYHLIRLQFPPLPNTCRIGREHYEFIAITGTPPADFPVPGRHYRARGGLYVVDSGRYGDLPAAAPGQ